MSGVLPQPTACPVCRGPLAEHHITKWYGRRYDVWSLHRASTGRSCFVVELAKLPAEFYRLNERRHRGRPPTRPADVARRLARSA